MRRAYRLTSQENIGSEYSNLRLGRGKAAKLPIPTSGAMGTYLSPRGAPHPSVHTFSGRSSLAHCLIIFRKVLNFLRLVSPPPHLPVFFAECVTSRPLCTQDLPSIQSPSKAHARERPGQRSNVLRFVHPRIQPRQDPFPTRRHIKDSSPRDRPRRGVAQCLTRGEHGVVLRRRAAPFQRFSSYVPLLGLSWISQTLHSRVLTEDYVAPRPGPIFLIDTNVKLGEHTGLWTYTIGQGARIPGFFRKLFVAAKDHKENAIYVALPEFVPSLSPHLASVL